jgi:hypothetical protein
VGGGGELKVIGTGTVRIRFKHKNEEITASLQNVLHVPELSVNLFSLISPLKRGVEVVLGGNELKIINRDTIIKGYRQNEGDLFTLDFERVQQPQDKALVATTNLKLWHQRMGHIPITKINSMIRNEAVEGLPPKTEEIEDIFCESCIYGKMKRKPFESSKPRDLLAGEMIYADVCGQLEVLSLGGSKYFITFKDEKISYRKALLIKTKLDVPQVMKTVINEIKIETGNYVKYLRTDNGREFFNKHVTTLLDEYGIIHELTAPYNSEQNGKAEREHQTVMDMVRSMMFGKEVRKTLGRSNCDGRIHNEQDPKQNRDKHHAIRKMV